MSTDEAEGSKRNIILGYEKVAEIDKRLAQVDTKLDSALDGFAEQNARQAIQHADHETRLRSLERTMTELVVTGATSKATWTWVWAALFTAGTFGLSVLNYLK